MTKFYLLVTAVAASALLTGPLQGQSPDSVLAISRGGTSILRVNEDAGLVVRDASGVGAIPATGAGVRMMWYPGHYAFRAGRATGSEWDLAGVGLGSTAFGTGNTASGTNSFAIGLASIASGDNSMASGESSTASGIASLAHNGTALGERSIAIGYGALATGATATAIGPSAIAIGTGSFVGGPSTANGSYAVALGLQNSASGNNSVAIGKNARAANRAGAIVISDASATFSSDSVFPTANNQFVVRATGGIRFYTTFNLVSGVEVPPGGGAWSTISDRNRKMDFAPLDGEDVLTRLQSVPVTTWSYIAQERSIRHAGPMAQDFYAAFGLGESDLLISTVDIDGITLAAVKALDARSATQMERIDSLEGGRLEGLERIAELEARLATLERERDEARESTGSLLDRIARLEALLDRLTSDGDGNSD